MWINGNMVVDYMRMKWTLSFCNMLIENMQHFDREKERESVLLHLNVKYHHVILFEPDDEVS